MILIVTTLLVYEWDGMIIIFICTIYFAHSVILVKLKKVLLGMGAEFWNCVVMFVKLIIFYPSI